MTGTLARWKTNKGNLEQMDINLQSQGPACLHALGSNQHQHRTRRQQADS
jgi:hypothetical protein